MTARVIVLHQPPAFTDLREALDWSHARHLRQRWWRDQRRPPLDAVGDVRADSFLAAVFATLVGCETTPGWSGLKTIEVLWRAGDMVRAAQASRVLAAYGGSTDLDTTARRDAVAAVLGKWARDCSRRIEIGS